MAEGGTKQELVMGPGSTKIEFPVHEDAVAAVMTLLTKMGFCEKGEVINQKTEEWEVV